MFTKRGEENEKENRTAACGIGAPAPLYRVRGKGKSLAKGNEQETADEKAQAGDLHGREDTVHGFEHDLHRAEDDGAEDDIQIAGIGTLHRFPSFQNTVAQV